MEGRISSGEDIFDWASLNPFIVFKLSCSVPPFFATGTQFFGAAETRYFDELEDLPEWLGNISSLEDLVITECCNLKNLPTTAAMKRLSKLRRLGIYGCCAYLMENFNNKSGSEWDKISHIPDLHYSSD